MRQVENDIKKIIDEVTCTKYMGKLKVIKEELPENSTLWMLLLFLDREMTPMILAYEGTEDEFKEFIRKEIKERKLQTIKFFSMHQELVDDDLLEYE